jgi:hypothetical protein
MVECIERLEAQLDLSVFLHLDISGERHVFIDLSRAEESIVRELPKVLAAGTPRAELMPLKATPGVVYRPAKKPLRLPGTPA